MSEALLRRERRYLLMRGQQELVERLHHQASSLHHHLLLHGAFSATEASLLHNSDGRLHVEKILMLLQSKTDTEYDVFCQFLEDYNLKDIKKGILSSKVIQTDIKDLQRHLGRCFSESLVDPLLGTCPGVDLQSVYQSVELHMEPGVGEYHSKPTTAYTDLLCQDKTRFAIIGCGNSGKTVLVRKMCRDWATLLRKEKKATHQEKTCERLSKFTLMLPVVLRCIQPGASLADTMQQQYGISIKQWLTIKFVLDSTPNNVLFLFDGLNEYNLWKSPEITSIMAGKRYQSAWCVITTRPGSVPSSSHWPDVRYHQVHLARLNDQQVKQYVSIFFSKAPGGKRLGRQLEALLFHHTDGKMVTSDVHMQELAIDVLLTPLESGLEDWFEFHEDEQNSRRKWANLPGLLGILCIVFLQTQQIPPTKEQLIEKFTDLLVSKIEGKISKNNVVGEKPVLSMLHNLGHIANQYNWNKLKLVFSPKDLEGIPLSVGESTIFYTFEMGSHVENSCFSFINRDIQEYLAAVFLLQSKKENIMEQFWRLLSENRDGLDDHNLVSFKTYFRIITNCEFLSLNYIIDFLSGKIKVATDVMETFVIACLTLQELETYPVANAQYIDPAVYPNEGEMFIILHIPLYNIYLKSDLKQAEVTIPQAHILHDNFCIVYWPIKLDALRITDLLSDSDTKLKLDRCSRCKESASLVYLHSSLYMIIGPTVDYLELNTKGNADLTWFCHKVKSLEINDSNLHGKGKWLARVLTMIGCSQVSIQRCNLVKQDMCDLQMHLEKMFSSTEMASLFLDNNYLRNSGPEISKMCTHIKFLKQLSLENNFLVGGDLEELSLFLEGNKECVLDTMSLSGNHLRRGGSHIARIMTVRTLTRLNVSHSSLKVGDLMDINEYFIKKEHVKSALKYLRLDGNNLKGCGLEFSILGEYLREIEYLSASDCNIPFKDRNQLVRNLMKTLEILPNSKGPQHTQYLVFPNLKVLIFNRNPFW